MACERTMVFGESTGLNIGVSVDAAKGTPVEVNTGFKRQVVGIVPSSQNRQGDRTKGEATSMISRFEIGHQGGADTNEFNNKVTIRSAFASGEAAVNVIGNDKATEIVNSILGPTPLVASRDPENVSTRSALGNFISKSDANQSLYLTLAQKYNLTVPAGVPPEIQVANAVVNPDNASGNEKILKELKDLKLIK